MTARIGMGVIGVCLGLLAAQPAYSDDGEIKIGLAIAQTGWMSAYDQAPSRAALLAIEDLNAKGGILGRKIVTSTVDTKSDLAEGAKAAQQLVDDGVDLLVVTCDYDNGAPAALVAQNAGVLTISLCAQDPKMGVQGIGDLAFSASSAAQVQGAAIAEWAYEKKGVRNAFVLLDDFIEYNKSVCAGFDAAWEGLKGAKVVGRDVFKNPDPSIATQITNIRNADPKPDALVICSLPPGGASALRQIRQAGIDTMILGTQAFDGNYWLSAVPDLSNFYLTAIDSIYGDTSNTDVNNLIGKYTAAYGGPPPTSTLLDGYALIQVWAHAAEVAKTLESKSVATALEDLKDFPTIAGPRSFSKEMHIQVASQYLIMNIEKGKISPVEYWKSKTPLSEDTLFMRKP